MFTSRSTRILFSLAIAVSCWGQSSRSDDTATPVKPETIGFPPGAKATASDKWVTFTGTAGPGVGKHIVLVSGDEEYRSEETLPQLAKILAKYHGFTCTVLFPIDPKDGTITPDLKLTKDIPGLEQLKNADLLVLFTRFRDLPDEQMQHIVDYLAAGKPIIGLRTATHAFAPSKGRKHQGFHWQSKDWPGGFGRNILGETWVSHHGHHGVESTRGIIAPGQEHHPILKGIKSGEIWGPTDVYGVHLPLPGDSQPLVLGQVLTGMKPTDEPVGVQKLVDKRKNIEIEIRKNDPMMPIAWTKTYYSVTAGKSGRVFTTTMGAATDFENSGVRRMLVNACYWAIGLDKQIPDESKVDIIGEFHPSPFKFDGHVRGKKPSDLGGL